MYNSEYIFSVQFSGMKYIHCVVQPSTTVHFQNFFIIRKQKLGRDSKISTGFFWTSLHTPFTFALFFFFLALYPFAVISLIHEYSYMLNPMSSFKESPHPETPFYTWSQLGSLGVQFIDRSWNPLVVPLILRDCGKLWFVS